VTTTFSDGQVNVTEHEVIDTGSSGVGVLNMDQRGDATCRAFRPHLAALVCCWLVLASGDHIVRGLRRLWAPCAPGPVAGLEAVE